MSINLSFDAVSIPSDLMWQHSDPRHGPSDGTVNQAQPAVAEEQRAHTHENEEAAALVAASGGSNARPIEMSFANAVPFRIGVGRITTTPIVILLCQGAHSSIATDDIWVFVSLIDAESGLSTGDDVLLGQRADNAHPILGHLSQTRTSLAYASFPDLIISKPGRFRLCITAIDTRYAKYMTHECKLMCSSMGQSYVLPAIISEAIEVVESKPMGSLGKRSRIYQMMLRVLTGMRRHQY